MSIPLRPWSPLPAARAIPKDIIPFPAPTSAPTHRYEVLVPPSTEFTVITLAVGRGDTPTPEGAARKQIGEDACLFIGAAAASRTLPAPRLFRR